MTHHGACPKCGERMILVLDAFGDNDRTGCPDCGFHRPWVPHAPLEQPIRIVEAEGGVVIEWS